MKQKGFTLIEVMIVFAIMSILAALVLPFIFGQSQSSNISWGFNGATETRCISGVQFVVGPRGYAQQIIGANGSPITCNN